MATEFDVINMALGHLNIERITGIEDTTPQAEAARTIFNTSRAAFLEEYPWSFAKRQMKPAMRTDTPTAWAYMYSCPNDFLCMYRVFISSMRGGAGTLPFDVMLDADGNNRVILCDWPDIVIDYGSKNTTLPLFSPLAVEALSYRMAFHLCQALKHSPDEQQTLFQTYTTLMKAAVAADAGNRSYAPLSASTFSDSRALGFGAVTRTMTPPYAPFSVLK